MLLDFLKLIRDGSAGSLSEAARILGISAGMANQIAEDLTRRGYLAEASPRACSENDSCSGCGSTAGCQGVDRFWELTEKGKSALL